MEALTASVCDMVLTKHPHYQPIETAAEITSSDFEMVKRPRENAQNVTNFLDIIENVDGPFDYESIKTTLLHIDEGGGQSIANLESKVGMKVFTPKTTQMQIAIVPKDDKFDIIKHYYIKAKVDMKQMERICHGEIKVLDWGDSAQETRKAFQLQFQQLGGFQVRLHKLEGVEVQADRAGRSKQEHVMTPDEIDLAYDYIRQSCGPDWDEVCCCQDHCHAVGVIKSKVI